MSKPMATPIEVLRAIHLAWFGDDASEEALRRSEPELLVLVNLLAPAELAELKRAFPAQAELERVADQLPELPQERIRSIEEKALRKLRGLDG